MTLYDHLYGRPPPDLLRRLVWIGPMLLALWLYAAPWPYRLALTVNALCPLLAIPLLLRWREAFVAGFDGGELIERRDGLAPLWFFPPMALAIRVFFDLEWAYSPWSFAAALAGGAAYTGLLALMDRGARGARLVLPLVFSTLWAWSSLMLANAELDRTPGRIQPARVVATDTDPYSLTVAIPGDRLPRRTLLASSKIFFSSVEGGQVCVDENPGAFGWRLFWLTPCEGLLRELPQKGAKPPAPPAPSPPR